MPNNSDVVTLLAAMVLLLAIVAAYAFHLWWIRPVKIVEKPVIDPAFMEELKKIRRAQDTMKELIGVVLTLQTEHMLTTSRHPAHADSLVALLYGTKNPLVRPYSGLRFSASAGQHVNHPAGASPGTADVPVTDPAPADQPVQRIEDDPDKTQPIKVDPPAGPTDEPQSS